MDQPTFKNLTGICIESDDVARFELTSELAYQKLEEALGWPLDPSWWPNQYTETGKSLSDPCLVIGGTGNETLEDPDEVIGSYRLFNWRESDVVLNIDPAVAIHAVKLVKGNITYKTFEDTDYVPQWVNGKVPFTKSLVLSHNCCSLLCELCSCDSERMLAVDADWAFATVDGVSTIPLELQKIVAELIAFDLDDNKNVKSESVLSHSYTKFDKVDPLVTYASVLKKYAGPNGTIRKTRIV